MFDSLIDKRRSIRKYLPRRIEAEKIERLIEAALRAPSSRDLRPCRFLFITDPSMLGKLARAKTAGSTFLADAALAAVVCADTEKSDVWVEDASIASTFLLLAAESLGLGACWIQIRNRMHGEGRTSARYVGGLLNIPQGTAVLSIIAIGYPAETKSPHASDSLAHEVVYRETYGRR